MPQDSRIIRRSRFEVNGRVRELVVLLLVAALVLAGASCVSKESVAEAMSRQAGELAKQGNYEEAVQLWDRVIREYPDTAAAVRAREDVILYRGLIGAKSRYPIQKARELMTSTARALESYRMKHGRLPAKLGDVLSEEPVDPWGNPLEYARSRGGRSYAVSCFGGDGVAGGTGEDADLMIRDGKFVTVKGGGERP